MTIIPSKIFVQPNNYSIFTPKFYKKYLPNIYAAKASCNISCINTIYLEILFGMKKQVCDLRVIKNIKLNHDNYLIELQSEEQTDLIIPGQFVNVLVRNSPTTFLRRPLSIHDVNYSKRTLLLLIKTVGEGTRKLVETKVGENLDIIYPLGNGFSRPENNQKILLIGGGVGIAPMMHMARESKDLGADVHILLGARSKNDHILVTEFEKYGRVHLTTNDGSLGHNGFVNDHILVTEFEKYGKVYLSTNDGSLGTKGFVIDHKIMNSYFDRLYCCGPDPMMHAVAKKAKQMNIDCEVSLENMMACGFGVCLCCVTKTNEGNKCVCTDGPVFNIKDLEWQI